MQLTDSIEAYAYGKSNNLVCEKEYLKCCHIMNQHQND